MWADSLLAAERAVLMRFIIWGAGSGALGLALLAMNVRRDLRSPLLDRFALQIAAWGVIALAIALLGWSQAGLRDYAGAARLVRTVQLVIALDVGMIGAALALCFRGWRRRREGLIGAGMGLLVHGIGWLVLHAAFASYLRSAT